MQQAMRAELVSMNHRVQLSEREIRQKCLQCELIASALLELSKTLREEADKDDFNYQELVHTMVLMDEQERLLTMARNDVDVISIRLSGLLEARAELQESLKSSNRKSLLEPASQPMDPIEEVQWLDRDDDPIDIRSTAGKSRPRPPPTPAKRQHRKRNIVLDDPDIVRDMNLEHERQQATVAPVTKFPAPVVKSSLLPKTGGWISSGHSGKLDPWFSVPEKRKPLSSTEVPKGALRQSSANPSPYVYSDPSDETQPEQMQSDQPTPPQYAQLPGSPLPQTQLTTPSPVKPAAAVSRLSSATGQKPLPPNFMREWQSIKTPSQSSSQQILVPETLDPAHYAETQRYN